MVMAIPMVLSLQRYVLFSARDLILDFSVDLLHLPVPFVQHYQYIPRATSILDDDLGYKCFR